MNIWPTHQHNATVLPRLLLSWGQNCYVRRTKPDGYIGHPIRRPVSGWSLIRCVCKHSENEIPQLPMEFLRRSPANEHPVSGRYPDRLWQQPAIASRTYISQHQRVHSSGPLHACLRRVADSVIDLPTSEICYPISLPFVSSSLVLFQICNHEIVVAAS